MCLNPKVSAYSSKYCYKLGAAKHEPISIRSIFTIPTKVRSTQSKQTRIYVYSVKNSANQQFCKTTGEINYADNNDICKLLDNNSLFITFLEDYSVKLENFLTQLENTLVYLTKMELDLFISGRELSPQQHLEKIFVEYCKTS